MRCMLTATESYFFFNQSLSHTVSNDWPAHYPTCPLESKYINNQTQIMIISEAPLKYQNKEQQKSKKEHEISPESHNKHRVLTKELWLRTRRIQRSCRGLRLALSWRPLAKRVQCLKSEPQNNHKHHNLKHKCSVVSKANVQPLWKHQLLYLMSWVN